MLMEEDEDEERPVMGVDRVLLAGVVLEVGVGVGVGLWSFGEAFIILERLTLVAVECRVL